LHPSSAEVVSRLLKESEVTNLAAIVRVSMSTAQSYQLSSSLNNISADMRGSHRNREHEPGISFVLLIVGGDTVD